MNLENLSTHDNNEMVNGKNVERTYDLSNFIEMMPESIFLALIDQYKVNLTNVPDTNQINQYLDTKNYILKSEWRNVSVYTNNIFWSIY